MPGHRLNGRAWRVTVRVSVVIPNHNYSRFLRQALDSVLNQTHPAFEVIVVDDGSTDDSLAVLSEYRGRIHVLQQRNQGVSAARNHGIIQSSGEYIALLDADDFWRPDKLACQIPLMADPAVGLVYSGIRYVNVDSQPLTPNLSGRRGRLLQDMALLRGTCVLAAPSSGLFRRDTLGKTGLFDVELSTAADWDLCRRIACHSSIETVREPLVYYRLHRSGMHLNLELYEHDMLHAFKQMFLDPAAREVLPLRRRSYGILYMTLAASYFRAHRWQRAGEYAFKSLLMRPAGMAYLAAFPIRILRQRLGIRAVDVEPIV